MRRYMCIHLIASIYIHTYIYTHAHAHTGVYTSRSMPTSIQITLPLLHHSHYYCTLPHYCYTTPGDRDTHQTPSPTLHYQYYTSHITTARTHITTVRTHVTTTQHLAVQILTITPVQQDTLITTYLTLLLYIHITTPQDLAIEIPHVHEHPHDHTIITKFLRLLPYTPTLLHYYTWR